MSKRNSNRERNAHKYAFKRAKSAINKVLSEAALNGGIEQVYLTVDSLFEDGVNNKEYDSLDDVIDDIKKRIHYGVDWTTKIVYTIADVAVENWYQDYTPTVYKRRDWLYDNYVVWNSGSYVSGYHGEVSVNPQYLSITYPMDEGDKFAHTGQDVIKAAEQGLHCAEAPQKEGKNKLGIWKELIGYLINNEFGEGDNVGFGQGIEASYGDSPILDSAFDAGFIAKKSPNIKWTNLKGI